MVFFVDAYNLLFKLQPSQGSLEQKRATVISSINEFALHLNLTIILVFDATRQKERLGIARGHYEALEIIYTEDKSADDFILKEVENARTPSQITVVTSDRELAGRSLQLGACTMSIRQFSEWLVCKKLRKRKTPIARDSPQNIQRLLEIFEKQLKEEEE